MCRTSLRGINGPFGQVSPTSGQIIYALLTRPPLYSFPEGNFLARLACLIHAANVRSEPGSNPSLVDSRLVRPAMPAESQELHGLVRSMPGSTDFTLSAYAEQAWTHVFPHINEAVQNVKDRWSSALLGGSTDSPALGGGY